MNLPHHGQLTGAVVHRAGDRGVRVRVKLPHCGQLSCLSVEVASPVPLKTIRQSRTLLAMLLLKTTSLIQTRLFSYFL